MNEDPVVVMEALAVVIKEFDEQAAKFRDMLQRSHHPNRAVFLQREAVGYLHAAEQGRKYLTYLTQQHMTRPLLQGALK